MAGEAKITGAETVPVVTLRNAHMAFGPVKALCGANISIRKGECIGLVGHNGAGKSTLVNVINGRLVPTGGDVTYRAHSPQRRDDRNSERARAAGMRSVFQELSLCPNLTVLENLRIPYRNMPRRAWRREARHLVTSSLDEIFPGHGIDPHALVGDLSIAQRQMVEIAIAFSKRDVEANLVILDEPTSSLDAAIAAQLLCHIRKFRSLGGAIIFITHMMGEIFEVASRIVVMKDGRIVADRDAAKFTRESLVDEMGHAVAGNDHSLAIARSARPGPEVLRMNNGLNARRGEVVGLAGLAGHGQAQALANYYFSSVSLWRAAREPKAVFVAGDRGRDGILPIWSVLRNLSLSSLTRFSSMAMVDRSAEEALARSWKDKIRIRTDHVENLILSLSGGNQQKVLFARALASSAPIVVMDDPMRGVDVGTKTEVYKMIREEADAGRTFLWYSTESEEVLECDRVFVFRNGGISAELEGGDITEENILRASFEMQEDAT